MRRLSTILITAVALATAGTGPGRADTEPLPPGHPGYLRRVWEPVDAGERLYPGTPRETKLFREVGAVAVTIDPLIWTNIAEARSYLAAEAGDKYEAAETIDATRFIVQAGQDIDTDPTESSDNALRAQLALLTGVVACDPVFRYGHADGGRLVITPSIIVMLKDGISPTAYFGTSDPAIARPLWINGPEYLFTTTNASSFAILTEVNAHDAHPDTEWAEPNASSPITREYLPNDPLIGSSWFIDHTGLGGTRTNADIRLAQAWDITGGGSSNIVVAIIDDGVEWLHPDLNANLFINVNDMNFNGIDDDGNGAIDDVSGYNFGGNNPESYPAHPEDRHGTSCAGLVAGVANNGIGAAGVAFRSRLLSIKITEEGRWLAIADIAPVIRYAAGLDGLGNQVWRGADILSMSFGYSVEVSRVVENALTAAGTSGRGGRGAVMFAASGNHASGYAWYRIRMEALPPGTYQAMFEYRKDQAVSSGLDAVRLSSIRLGDANRTRTEFVQPVLPPGWISGGDVPFAIEDNPAFAYSTARYQARSGVLGHNQTSWLLSPPFLRAETESVYVTAWVDTDAGDPTIGWQYPPVNNQGDWLFVRLFHIDTATWYDFALDAGVPGNRRNDSGNRINTAMDVTTVHPMVLKVGAVTDWGYRSHYSEYQANGIDFLAPSGGGNMGVWTTDIQGAGGYNTREGVDGDYTQFDGTSAACPIAAGVGALILSMNTNLTRVQVRDLMRNSADQIGEVPYVNNTNRFYGYGRINAYQALLDLGVPGVVTAYTDVVRNQRVYDIPGTQIARDDFSIEPGATVTMRASRVVLQDGFTAKSGSVFRTEITP
jgi:subtilisin family serine protease